MSKLDEFYAFKNTSGDSDNNQPGDSQGCLKTIACVLCVLWIIGKLFG